MSSALAVIIDKHFRIATVSDYWREELILMAAPSRVNREEAKKGENFGTQGSGQSLASRPNIAR